MNFIKMLKIRKENKKKREMQYQAKISVCCDTCKYCYVSDSYFGYSNYDCYLRELNFSDSKRFEYKCNNYKPIYKYKKYLENKVEYLIKTKFLKELGGSYGDKKV